MRWFLLLVALLTGALWYFYGLRLGYATITPLWTLNAQGTSQYKYNLVKADMGTSLLRVVGSCDARSGSVTLTLRDPDGGAVGSQLCRGGKYSLGLTGEGKLGVYTLDVKYTHYNGRLELNEQRE